MSIAVMTAVWSLDLPDSQKIVLLALADCANDEGLCWPSMATLTKKCSKGERTIQGVIKQLVEAGHLSRFEVVGKGCKYQVHPRRQSTSPVNHYLYRTEHKGTGQYYIGARSCEGAIEADDYMGSGNWVKSQDRAALSKTILETYETRAELALAEAAVTARYFSDPLCMNMKVATPATLAPRKDCPPQGTTQTPAEAADKPSRTIIKKPKGKSAHEIPTGWQPLPFGRGTKSSAIVDGWSPDERDRHLEHFIAHHTARRSKFDDWQAAWSTWVLNSAKFGGQRNGNANRANAGQGGYGRSSLARAIDEGLEWLQ